MLNLANSPEVNLSIRTDSTRKTPLTSANFTDFRPLSKLGAIRFSARLQLWNCAVMLSKLKATIDRIVESVKPVLPLVVPASGLAIIPWFFLAVGQLPLLNDWMPLAALLIVAVVGVWIVVALGPRTNTRPP